MQKNGFTLVELMAVIAIVGIIATIGTYSVIGVKRAINEELWKEKVALIENRARVFGEDNLNRWINKVDKCYVDGENYTCWKENGKNITVQTLIDKNYLTTKDTIKKGKDKEVKVIRNDTIESDVTEISEGAAWPDGVVNGKEIIIYYDNGTVYAKYQG